MQERILPSYEEIKNINRIMEFKIILDINRLILLKKGVNEKEAKIQALKMTEEYISDIK